MTAPRPAFHWDWNLVSLFFGRKVPVCLGDHLPPRPPCFSQEANLLQSKGNGFLSPEGGRWQLMVNGQ